MNIKTNIIVLFSLIASQIHCSDEKPPLAPKVFIMTSSQTTSKDKFFSPLTMPHTGCELCCAKKRRDSASSASSVSPIAICSVVSTAPSPIQNPKQ